MERKPMAPDEEPSAGAVLGGQPGPALVDLYGPSNFVRAPGLSSRRTDHAGLRFDGVKT